MNESSKQAWIRSAVQQYEAPLMRYALRKTGCVELAREVVQDTFLKMWQSDQASLDGRLAPWLYTVCRNRALDVCRKERRMKTLEHEPAAGGSRESAIAGQAHSESDARIAGAATEERHTALRGAVQQLNAKQQEAIRLKFQSGLSYREIAEVMDITVNHVGVLLHNAIKVIRERLSMSDDGEGVMQSEQAR